MLCYHGIRTSDESTPFGGLHVTEGDVRTSLSSHCRIPATRSRSPSIARRVEDSALPPRPVIVTFDDGYRGVLDHALPILERHGIPAAVFASVKPVLDAQHFWFDSLSRRDGEAAVLRARALAYHDWRTLVGSIETAADPTESHRPLTLAELTRLASNPLIEIGAHTMTHPTLALARVDDQRREIADCRAALEHVLHRPVTAFLRARSRGSVPGLHGGNSERCSRSGVRSCVHNTRVVRDARQRPLRMPRSMMLDTGAGEDRSRTPPRAFVARGVS